MKTLQPRLRRRLAWGYLVVASAIVVVGTMMPDVQTIASLFVVVSVPVCCAVGVLSMPRAQRRPWELVAAGFSCSAIASLIRLTLPESQAETLFAEIAPNLLSISGYIMVIAGIHGFLRAAGPRASDGALLDGTGVCVAAAIAVFTTLTIPSIDSGTGTGAAWEVGIYPVLSIVLAFFAIRLLLSGQRRTASSLALIGALGVVFLADLLYAMADRGFEVDLTYINIMYAAASIGVAFATLHPSAPALTDPAPPRARELVGVRLVTLGLAVATPLLVVVSGQASTPASIALVAVGGLILILLMVTRVAGAVNTNASAERRLLLFATLDGLTGLPNRTAASEYLNISLQDARGADTGVGVLLLNVDRFKTINETWGHSVGDKLLTDISVRLQGCIRNEDFLSRVGGDEFIIAITDAVSESAAYELGIRLVEMMREPFTLPGGDMQLSVSVGVAYDHGTCATEDLINMAATAMHHAKSLGRGTVARYDSSLRDDISRRLELEAGLQQALENDELSVVYQPIVDIDTGRPVAFEALLRWNSQRLGFVSPVDFIPIAEDSGLIRPIGAWVMREATRQLKDWHDAGASPDLALSVNLSGRQLEDFSTTDMILDRLDELGLPAANLWVEVTESVMLQDNDTLSIEAGLLRLRDRGVSVAADDFGTGYSSLSYLRRFPFNHVKVDRSFVNGLGESNEDEGIVAAVLAMAGALGMHSVAEGIETTVQRDRLKSLGCRLAQGYLFARPLSVGDATELLGLSTGA